MKRVRAIYAKLVAWGLKNWAKELLKSIEADESSHRSEIEKIKAKHSVAYCKQTARVYDLEARDEKRVKALTRLRGNRDRALKRIAELEAECNELDTYWMAEVKARDKCIAELEAECALAKREPPSLPDSVRASVEFARLSYGHSLRDLIAFVDATFPKPVPQWELDAQKVEAGAVPVSERAAIAARIREAHRESK